MDNYSCQAESPINRRKKMLYMLQNTTPQLPRIFTTLFLIFSLLHVQSAVSAEEIAGKVLETMNSGSYTYIYLDDNGQKKWVAVPESAVNVGDEVRLMQGTEMGSYTSPTLGRTFESIIFSAGVINIKRVVGTGNATEEEDDEKIMVDKATGTNAYTIAETFKDKGTLNGKTITVRGKVTKTSKYQGNNFIHLKDGSGSKKRGNHQLVVTSKDSAAEGEIITVQGTMSADKSFGFLTYEVLIEDAAITKDGK